MNVKQFGAEKLRGIADALDPNGSVQQACSAALVRLKDQETAYDKIISSKNNTINSKLDLIYELREQLQQQRRHKCGKCKKFMRKSNSKDGEYWCAKCQCPECKSARLVHDVERNELTCANCGLIVKENYRPGTGKTPKTPKYKI